LGRTQHRRQIASQVDSQLALVWCQDDLVDEATKRLRGFRAGFGMLESLSERFAGKADMGLVSAAVKRALA